MTDPADVAETVWAALEGRLAGTITDGLKGLLDGAEEDIRTFGLYMAQDLVLAIRRKDAAWEHEIRAQAGLLMEVNRLRAANAQHALVMQVLHALIRMGLEIAATFVAGFFTDALRRTP